MLQNEWTVLNNILFYKSTALLIDNSKGNVYSFKKHVEKALPIKKRETLIWVHA
jgi:hypothetical protein